jgi:hypothetical protein
MIYRDNSPVFDLHPAQARENWLWKGMPTNGLPNPFQPAMVEVHHVQTLLLRKARAVFPRQHRREDATVLQPAGGVY